LSIGHVSPEAAEGGTIGLVQAGDMIVIDIPARSIAIDISEDDILIRREAMASCKSPWQPVKRDRKVSVALRAYASMTTSADRGAVRLVP